MNEAPISAFMQASFLSLAPGLPMKQAVARLVESASPAAPVIDDDGQLVGILTQKDCFASALNAAYYQQWSATVRDHMSPQVETLDLATDLVTAAERFRDLPYRAFPVTDGDTVVGMLDRADLLKAFLTLG